MASTIWRSLLCVFTLEIEEKDRKLSGSLEDWVCVHRAKIPIEREVVVDENELSDQKWIVWGYGLCRLVESTNTWNEQSNKITKWVLLNDQKHHFKSHRNFQRRKSRWTPKDPDNEHLELFKEREGKTATCMLNHFKCPWFAGAVLCPSRHKCVHYTARKAAFCRLIFHIVGILHSMPL